MPPILPPSTTMSHPAKKSDSSTRPARIVPAIPLPYSRAPQKKENEEIKQSRPTLTPDRSKKSTGSPRHNGVQRDGSALQSTSSFQEPMAPDSIPSAIIKETSNGEQSETNVGRQEQEGAWKTRVANGTSNDKDTPSTQIASQPDQVYTNGSHGLKHENAVNGEKDHLRAHSRDFAPIKIPAKLPPPFYPKHQTPSSANSFTSTQSHPMQQLNDQEHSNAPGNMHHPRPVSNLVFGGQADSSDPSPAPATSARGGMYPPPPLSYASAPFPPPGLLHPLVPQGFNPQASAFQFGSQIPTRSHSQSSHDLQSPVHSVQHIPAGSLSMSDTSGSALNAQAAMALKSYLEPQFGSPDFSDVTVKIIERAQSADPIVIQAHRIVLARSPKLRELVGLHTNVIHIDLRTKYLESNTFIHVLRYLYGAALPARNNLAGQPMDQSLALAAAGWTCRLPEITAQGLDYASSWMGWETVETAIGFALEGGLAPFFRTDEIEASPEPMFGEFSGQFLQFILNWLATNIPSNFQFIASAPQLTESPRLPGTLENRPSTANPRLSLIRFGDLPSQESSQSTALLSSIMLSLPLGPLKYLLLHPAFWCRPGHTQMVRAVMEERETRRKKALESKRHLPGATAEMREAMYWKESFVPATSHHAQGFALIRECLKTVIGGLDENGNKDTMEES